MTRLSRMLSILFNWLGFNTVPSLTSLFLLFYLKLSLNVVILNFDKCENNILDCIPALFRDYIAALLFASMTIWFILSSEKGVYGIFLKMFSTEYVSLCYLFSLKLKPMFLSLTYWLNLCLIYLSLKV
jgi:hypothetical protein